MRECPTCHGFGTYAVSRPDTAVGLYFECVDCGGTGMAIDRQLLRCEPVGQSRRKSMLEIAISTAIGFLVSLVLTAIVMPAFGYPTTWAHDFWITTIFTVASLVRGYCVRRAFEVWR